MTTVRELVPLLVVEDIARSLEFYRDRLGFAVVARWEPDGRLAWGRLERDGVAVMLQQSCAEDGPAAGRGRGVVFYFQCADASAEYSRLTALGLRLRRPEVAFYGMNQLFVHDPDGYELCFQNPTC